MRYLIVTAVITNQRATFSVTLRGEGTKQTISLESRTATMWDEMMMRHSPLPQNWIS